ncbi:helix-turn-helix domain-containing protein [Mycolicibacterium peregrinum]|uniref:helix-turn-helix domain-containing protein n=1 Tax=Mycolicibacterium peregrinum TaxID=43304 RepID=UPI000DA24811
MSLGEFDLGAALRCARIVVALYQPRCTPPQRILDHLADLERIASSSDSGTKHEVRQEESTTELISTTEAAQILGCSTRYVRKIATSLDGHRIGRTWTFPRQEVEDYAAHLADHRTA